MRKVWLAALAVALAGPVFGQDPAPEAESTVEKDKAALFHTEMFFSLGHSFHENHVDPEGRTSDGNFTLAYGVQFAPGKRHWVKCTPGSDPECTEANGPRIALGGVALALSSSGYRGIVGVQFPLVTLRIVRNAWLGTAVTVWPWAERGARNASFTASLSIAFAKEE
ncbi:MAG TPA: hypothetical protein VD862_00115 [Candidatus Paceibacterota bacterium]|nr:hypothetical protein [Candidatus Paceibacterota bacterium]